MQLINITSHVPGNQWVFTMRTSPTQQTINFCISSHTLRTNPCFSKAYLCVINNDVSQVFFSMEQIYMFRVAHRLNNTTRFFVHVTALFSFINTNFPCHAYNNLTNAWLAHKISFFYWLKQSPTPTSDIALAAAHEQWVARLTRNVEVTQHCLCLKCKKGGWQY